jgi:hypothetical protein
LVDNGTYVIGHREFTGPNDNDFRDSGIITEDGWRTIDKVLRPDTHDFYSSKPPLLSTLIAGEYWLLKRAFGWSIVEQRWRVMRSILLTVNVLPLVLYLLLLSRLLERLGTSDWGRLYVLAAASFGTLMTPFVITLNNHSVAACSALFALYPAVRIWQEGKQGAVWFLGAGFFAGFTACTELPAAAGVALLFLFLFLRSPSRTLVYLVPAALVPVAGFFLTNYWAIGQWQPAYDNFGGPWYEFAGSHWRIEPGKEQHGIDWAYQVEGRGMYAFHLLLGHHGLFALSPIYLLSVAGMLWGMSRWREQVGTGAQPAGMTPHRHPPSLALVALLTLVLTLLVVGFYTLVVNDRNRNYGGWTSGPRWLMWLTPFLLLTLLPVADWLSTRRWGRGLAYLVLAMSVLSASYPAWTPWRHPWLYDFFEARGWIRY